MFATWTLGRNIWKNIYTEFNFPIFNRHIIDVIAQVVIDVGEREAEIGIPLFPRNLALTWPSLCQRECLSALEGRAPKDKTPLTHYFLGAHTWPHSCRLCSPAMHISHGKLWRLSKLQHTAFKLNNNAGINALTLLKSNITDIVFCN